MQLKGDTVISAQVLLPAASGKKIESDTLLTSANVAEYAPAPQTVADASQALARLGFQTGNLVGVSFSITAPASTFRKVFGQPLVSTERGAVQFRARDGSLTEEIPPAAWPASLSGLVAAITFVPPPDFGPTAYF